MQKFLIIQTAFIGDVVLATGLIEKLHRFFPEAKIDFLLRKGNESLFANHPFLHELLVWDKKKKKFSNLLKMLKRIRRNQYDKVICVQRFANAGFLAAFSGAEEKIGFDKNPFSFLFTKKVKHSIGNKNNSRHEIERNNDLIKDITDAIAERPRLYPSASDAAAMKVYKTFNFITISPASVWFTKQYPKEKWIDFINKIPDTFTIYLLGSENDKGFAEQIKNDSNHEWVINLCGKLSFLQSAELMKGAVMNFLNDSAPMHFASAVNAPVAAIYCSTLPSFGFGPLSDKKFVIDTEENLSCRPCGLHGKKACPLKHFKCAFTIKEEQLLKALC